MAKGRFARINLDGKSCSKTKPSTAAALAAGAVNADNLAANPFDFSPVGGASPRRAR